MDRDTAYEQSKEQTEAVLDYYREHIIQSNPRAVTVTFRPSPKYADFDFYVDINGVFDHYLEVKIRYHDFGKYQYDKMPLRKHTFAEHMINHDNKTSMFLCCWTGNIIQTIGVLDLSEEPGKVETMVARYDRNEALDMYALYHMSRYMIIDTRNVIFGKGVK